MTDTFVGVALVVFPLPARALEVRSVLLDQGVDWDPLIAFTRFRSGDSRPLPSADYAAVDDRYRAMVQEVTPPGGSALVLPADHLDGLSAVVPIGALEVYRFQVMLNGD